MGSVLDSTFDREIHTMYANTRVLNKEKRRDCWALFFYSCGCAANAEAFHDDISKPYDMECQLKRKRLECAMAIYAKEPLGEQAALQHRFCGKIALHFFTVQEEAYP